MPTHCAVLFTWPVCMTGMHDCLFSGCHKLAGCHVNSILTLAVALFACSHVCQSAGSGHDIAATMLRQEVIQLTWPACNCPCCRC